MKAIMISIRPQWVEKILNGIKKDEVRKGTALYKAINKLIEEQGVAPMLIYCTKGQGLVFDSEGKGLVNSKLFPYAQNCPEHNRLINGKVVAQFNATADLLELRMILGGLYFTRAEYECENCFDPKLNDFNENTQMDNFELLHYTGEKLGTLISDIHINDLEIFDKPKEISEFGRMESNFPGCENKCYHCEWYFSKTCIGKRIKPLTHAPRNGWCYVEVEQ